MKRDEILILCNLNSEVIVSYIADLESRYSDLESRYSDLESQYNELESQNIELREQINELESRSNQNRQNGNKPPSTGSFGNKKTKSSSLREPSCSVHRLTAVSYINSH
jgi:DNA repair exonuclease SbcCD ATPase subunit